jgi:hypothetical protein
VAEGHEHVRAFCETIGKRFQPRLEWVVRPVHRDGTQLAAALKSGESLVESMFVGKTPDAELPTAYLCSGSTCQPPVMGQSALSELLETL